MKKIILFALLAIVVVPTFVMAQDCPTPASTTATVTFKRVHIGPTLDGIFTINGNGNTVQFSKGNLQYQATTNTWQFAAHQYDMIGADNANIASDYSGWIDLFGWATNGSALSGTHYQPYDNTATVNTYGNLVAPDGGEPLTAIADWGSNMAGNFRTLSDVEWSYILDTRTTSGTIDGVSNARFVRAKILTDGNIGVDGIDFNICGLILFPDNFDGSTTPTGVTWSNSNINVHAMNFINACTCTTAGWAELETAGCVFLPCAGYRDGTTITNIGSEGFYWSATSRISTTAAALHIPSTNPVFGFERHRGHAVRLVHVVSE